MSRNNSDFFINKREWSRVKDDLLAWYLKPYVSKILHTNKPLIYVDCFAGPGVFKDGNLGSPLIALQILKECKEKTSSGNTIIESVFIELEHAKELKANLRGYSDARIISGSYEENISGILKGKQNYNVFLYIDPYGIKSLHFSFFDSFSSSFNSIELLINLNSFGFIREACHVLGVQFSDKAIFDALDEDLQEVIQGFIDRTESAINKLDSIAGGDYWRQIIEDYKAKRIDGYQAESIFADQYCKKLRQKYRYVLNMPIKVKKGQRPKYRMIHATNHREGCLLMVDNICKRWEVMQDIQNGDQYTLWQEDFDNQPIDIERITKTVEPFYSRYRDGIFLTDSLADFFSENGPICSTSEVRKVLSNCEKKGIIEIERTPRVGKNGKKSSFMTEDKDHRVFVRWIK